MLLRKPRRLVTASIAALGLIMAGNTAFAGPEVKCALTDALAADGSVSLVKALKLACKTADADKAEAKASQLANKQINKANKVIPKLFAAGKCDPDYVQTVLDKDDDGELDDYPRDLTTPAEFDTGFDVVVEACNGVEDI